MSKKGDAVKARLVARGFQEEEVVQSDNSSLHEPRSPHGMEAEGD